MLLELGADVDSMKYGNKTSLVITVDLCHTKTVKILLDWGADIDIQKGRALRAAVEDNSVELVENLLKHGTKMELYDENRLTLLHQVANSDGRRAAGFSRRWASGVTKFENWVAGPPPDYYIAELLLKNKANPHATASLGQTPLHIAALYQSEDMPKLLMQHGASCIATIRAGITPLAIATMLYRSSIAECMVEQQLEFMLATILPWNPLHTAARHSAFAALKLLLQDSTNLSPPDSAGWTSVFSTMFIPQRTK